MCVHIFLCICKYVCADMCVYVCLHVYILCLCRYVYIHAYVYICVCVYMCTCIWVCMYECIVCVYLCVYECMCVYCICLYVYVCLCIHLYIHIHTYSLDEVMPLGIIMPPARAIDHKTSVPDMRNLLSSYLIRTELLSELSKRLPKQHKLYCPWKHPEVGGKSLLLETPCTLDTELRGSTLDLTWKPPP